MAITTTNAVEGPDVTPDPMSPPTTSYLARTTSTVEVLAGYVEIVASLSTTRNAAHARCTKVATRK
jgi:hypothetical protein